MTKTKALSEFTFTASTIVAAKQTVHTAITGRVIRGRGIAYALTVGHKKTQVVRIRSGTYVRSVPGTWSKLATPKSVVNPTATLVALLRELTPTAVSRSSGDTRVVGVLAANAAKSAGIPATGAPATAVVLLDRQSRVIAVTLRGTTTAGSHVVHLSVISRYGHFDHVAPIRRP